MCVSLCVSVRVYLLQELEWSFRLFSEMRESGIVPNGVTCSALMDACLKADELDLAFAVLEHMLDVGIEPTEVLLTGLCIEPLC